MKQKQMNHAYIDGANLHKGIQKLGWSLDYKRFRIWLKDKYHVEKAYLFIGLLPKMTALYEHLREAGFILVFKQIAYDGEGKVKGNCDADLVLHAVKGFYENEYNKAVLVSGGGDFASLVEFLNGKDKLERVLAPDHEKCSILLKRTKAKITFLDELQNQLSQKEKAPDADKTV